MDEMIRMMQMGGPLMYAVLLLTLMVPITALAMGVATAFRVWLPAVAWLLMPGLVVLSGSVGWIHGQSQVLMAVGAASVEMKDVLLLAGLGISLIPQWFGFYLAGLCLLGTAICASLGAVIGTGKGSVRWTLGGAAGAMVLSFAVALGPVVLSFMRRSSTGVVLALMVLVAGAALAVAGLRLAEEEADRRRGAAMRVQVALYGLLALVAVTAGMVLHGHSRGLEAVSKAAPDQVGALLYQALELGELAVGGGVIAIVGLLIASLPVVGPALRHATGARAVIGALLVVLVLVVLVAVPGISHWRSGRVIACTGMMRALAAADEVPALPTPGPQSPAIGGFDSILIHGAGGWTRRDESDLPYAYGEFDPTSPLLLAPANLRARSVLGAEWMTAEVEAIHVLTRQESSPRDGLDDLLRSQALGTVDFARYMGPGDTETASSWGYGYESLPRAANSVFAVDGTAHEQAESWGMTSAVEEVWLVGRGPGGVSLGTPEIAALAIAERVGARGAEFVVFVPGDTWSLQDLLDLCLAVSTPSLDSRSYATSPVACAFAEDLPAPL